MLTSQETTTARAEHIRLELENDELEPHSSERPPSSGEIEQSTKSWRAPSIMLASLAIGLGLALAHHFICLSLNNKRVADAWTSQAWIFRLSTALAFLVKVAFATSVGTAYVQYQWLRLRQNNFRTDQIDALTGVLGSLFSFLTSTIWLKHPVLTFMALVSW
jgi:uncharacterized membrane protein YcjF (UPF0283 family)